jgi:glucose/arabinose dehydrogenase
MQHVPREGPGRRQDVDGRIGRWLAILVLLLVPVLAISVAEDAMGGIRSIVGAGEPERAAVRAPGGRDVRTSTGRTVRAEVVASDLDTPWDLSFAPDGSLWFTERGGRVSRLDLSAGTISVLGQIDVHESGEAGLMGMAFHPAFPDSPTVYFAHSYRAGGGIRNRLIRATFRDGRLGGPEVLLDDIPGRSNHDGARLAVGPDRMLYMTMGDAGNAGAAQDRESPSGKILRLTLDGQPAPGNPFGNAVWSLGHRNPQGLAFMSDGSLYATEHGPSEADEVNLIEPGLNYGWPTVRGDCDSGSEVEFCSAHQVVEPLAEYSPTIGISGLDVYESDRIPGWRGSLIYTSLRGEKLLRLVLAPNGRAASGQEMILDGQYGRLRDVVVGPDGTLHIATSNRDGRGRPSSDDDRIIRIVP